MNRTESSAGKLVVVALILCAFAFGLLVEFEHLQPSLLDAAYERSERD